jgi:hypothetical protein
MYQKHIVKVTTKNTMNGYGDTSSSLSSCLERDSKIQILLIILILRENSNRTEENKERLVFIPLYLL